MARIAADISHLFKNERVCETVLRSGHGSRQPSAAGTHDKELYRAVPLFGNIVRKARILGSVCGRHRSGGSPAATSSFRRDSSIILVLLFWASPKRPGPLVLTGINCATGEYSGIAGVDQANSSPIFPNALRYLSTESFDNPACFLSARPSLLWRWASCFLPLLRRRLQSRYCA